MDIPAHIPFDLADAEAFLAREGVPAYRVKQLRTAIFEQYVEDPAELTTFPAELREALAARYGRFNSLTTETVLHAAAGDAHKALLRTHDGHAIESVLLQVKAPYWTVCVSSQVGCAMGCHFCATGTMGLTRNLTAMEIAWQVLSWKKFLRDQLNGQQLTSVVYMGMGEPLMNLRAVTASLRMLIEDAGMAASRFAVSTSGIAPMISQFVDTAPRGVKLAISLHAPTDELRSLIVPVNDRFPLADLLAAARMYVKKTGQKIFFEYVVLKGINDQPQQAKDLGRILRPIGRSHMNLINMNAVPGLPFEPTPLERLEAFREEIRAEGIECTIRRDHGQDIMGACGQLVTIGSTGTKGTTGSTGTKGSKGSAGAARA